MNVNLDILGVVNIVFHNIETENLLTQVKVINLAEKEK